MWKNGQKVELANRVGTTPQLLNDIISRRKPCPAKLAIKLVPASRSVLGCTIALEDWLENKTTKNPYFRGEI